MSTKSVPVAMKNEDANKPLKYKLVAPEGGWGYIVAPATAVIVNVTAQPMCAFGLVYGNFLKTIGDETTGTTLANGVFNTVFSFTGLLSNYLLMKYSYRTVALIGAAVFAIGSFSTIFVVNLYQLVISFGVIQGVGFGLLLPASYSAVNAFFQKKINLIMGVCQALMAAMSIVSPALCGLCMEYFGFRGTVALLAVLSLNAFPGALSLFPVKSYLKKEQIFDDENVDNNQRSKSVSLGEEVLKSQVTPLMVEEGTGDVRKRNLQRFYRTDPRPSISSLGEGYLSISTTNVANLYGSKKSLPKEEPKTKMFDLSLFMDPVFMNISIGMSLAFTSDMVFISIMPILFKDMGFTTFDTAKFMAIYFITDFLNRLLFSFLSTSIKVRNRYLLFTGVTLTAAIRCGLFVSHNYTWILCTCGALGFFRCLIQTPLPLVFTEEYPTNFSTAFSLFMVVCGVISLVFGPLMSFVKQQTGTNDMGVHVLTLALVICSVSWTVELLGSKLKSKTVKNDSK
ncbi:uncharacterized protein LOC109608949 [Aethina tumida]|uniref:uncharacterized protein LOC109608949 n=1 Tax=Aethina tumida TaxID=116153 RepID=UPI00214752D8|nr:uncharacterized protein LOC109608949 [Aethina tumida]